MGFSIWVADDPELSGPEASDYPSFAISIEGMAFLRQEMGAHRMLQRMPSSGFETNDGEYVPADELLAALEVARPEAVTASDDEARQLWQNWLSFLERAVDHGGIRVY